MFMWTLGVFSFVIIRKIRLIVICLLSYINIRIEWTQKYLVLKSARLQNRDTPISLNIMVIWLS